jgi:MOSC domain-containing protein YiiM
MRLVSANVGQAQPISNGQPSGLTGIHKVPVDGAVEITVDGLRGDTIVDGRHHGGVDQAVYVYATIDYDWWTTELEYELPPGTFGENLTISGLESARVRIGDRLHIGPDPVTLEVTAPRAPCATLAARMGDPAFVRRFKAAARPGMYCRVIREGPVRAGDPVSLEPWPGETVTILDMFRDHYAPHLDAATLRRYLAAPIAIRERATLEDQLRRLR